MTHREADTRTRLRRGAEHPELILSLRRTSPIMAQNGRLTVEPLRQLLTQIRRSTMRHHCVVPVLRTEEDIHSVGSTELSKVANCARDPSATDLVVALAVAHHTPDNRANRSYSTPSPTWVITAGLFAKGLTGDAPRSRRFWRRLTAIGAGCADVCICISASIRCAISDATHNACNLPFLANLAVEQVRQLSRVDPMFGNDHQTGE